MSMNWTEFVNSVRSVFSVVKIFHTRVTCRYVAHKALGSFAGTYSESIFSKVASVAVEKVMHTLEKGLGICILSQLFSCQ